MRGRIIKVMSIIFVLGILMTNSMRVYGYKSTIQIPALGAGEYTITKTRSGEYSTVSVRCIAVYPRDSYQEDNFTKMRARIRNEKNTNIGKVNEVILVEGNKECSSIKIAEGYLNTKKVVFCFYGNSSKYPAEARVEYFPK